MPFICQNTIKRNRCILVSSLIQVLKKTIEVDTVDCTTAYSTTKHILIDRDENGILATEVFSEQQTSEMFLKILGYK
jgi:uncharacterized protein YuzE